MQRGKNFGVRQRHAGGVAGFVAQQVQFESLSGFELDRAVGEGADAQLRSLQVEQNADRPPAGALQIADDLRARLVIGMAAMTEIQAKHIHPGIEQGFDAGAVRGGRAEGGDDFGFTIAMHVLSFNSVNGLQTARLPMVRSGWPPDR